MRHNYKGRKLGTDFSHTKAMKKSLVNALFLNDRIKTVESRAKEIRPNVDKIITWAKKGDLHSRRLAIAALGDKELVREIFEKVEQGMFADRQGGYTRIMKLGNRKGDNAPMVIMELVTEPVKKKEEPKPAAKKATKKAAPRRSRLPRRLRRRKPPRPRPRKPPSRLPRRPKRLPPRMRKPPRSRRPMPRRKRLLSSLFFSDCFSERGPAGPRSAFQRMKTRQRDRAIVSSMRCRAAVSVP